MPRGLGRELGGLPERSKSKGWHVWTFFDAPVRARDVRRIFLKAAVTQAGLPTMTEVFPKQDRLTAETPLGNYGAHPPIFWRQP